MSITVHNTTVDLRVLIVGVLPGEEMSTSTAAEDGDKTEETLSSAGGEYIYVWM